MTTCLLWLDIGGLRPVAEWRTLVLLIRVRKRMRRGDKPGKPVRPRRGIDLRC